MNTERTAIPGRASWFVRQASISWSAADGAAFDGPVPVAAATSCALVRRSRALSMLAGSMAFDEHPPPGEVCPGGVELAPDPSRAPDD